MAILYSFITLIFIHHLKTTSGHPELDSGSFVRIGSLIVLTNYEQRLCLFYFQILVTPPLDVEGIDSDFTKEELNDIVREGRGQYNR